MDTLQEQRRAEWWRWPAIPFAAAGAFVAAGFAMGAFQWLSVMFSVGSTNGWYYRFIVPVFILGAAGYAYGYASCATAPRSKVMAGAIMTTVLAVIAAGNVALTWLLPQYSIGASVQASIGSAVTVTASIIAVTTHKG